MLDHNRSVAVIGGGPIGLFSVFALGLVGFKATVIESQEFVGGQCAMMYPTKNIYDIPGIPAITGGGLIDSLVAQANRFEPTYILNCQVTNILKTKSGRFSIGCLTSSGETFEQEFDFVLITSGRGAAVPRKMEVDNNSSYTEGKIIYRWPENWSKFTNSVAVVVGGGDSAAECVLELHGIAKKIYWLHRRTSFPCMESIRSQIFALANLQSSQIKIIAPATISNILPQDDCLQINLDGNEDHKQIYGVDYIFPFLGIAQNSTLVSTIDAKTVGYTLEVDVSTMESSMLGLYAAGDVATYKNKLKLIVCGFHESMVAAHHMRSVVYGGAMIGVFSTSVIEA